MRTRHELVQPLLRAWVRASVRAWVCLGLCGVCFGGASARADSPLSSSNLAGAYPELAALAQDEAERVLLDDARPFADQLAVLDALGFGHPDVPRRYVAALAKRKGVPLDDLAKRDLSARQKAVFGYALAMADIWTLAPYGGKLGIGNDLRKSTPRELLDDARRAQPKVFSIALADTLVIMQGDLDGGQAGWCRIYQRMKKLLAQFPQAERDLRPASVDAAAAYAELYRESCPNERAPPEEHADADEVNALVRFGAHGERLLIATQGGFFVLDARTLDKQLFFAEQMCFHAVADDAGTGLVSCSRGVYAIAPTSDKPTKTWTLERVIEGGLDLYDAPGGPLLKEARTWRRFGGARWQKIEAPVRTTPAFDPYFVLVLDVAGKGAGRQVWSVDFLRAVVHDGVRLERDSDGYPGRDPRSLTVDPRGRVWAIDFEDGFLRSDDGARFVKVGPVPTQASAVVFDVERGRMLLLPYRADPLVIDGLDDEALRHPRAVDRRGLDYLRDVVLLDDGRAVIGGTPGLLVVDGKAGTSEARSLRKRPR